MSTFAERLKELCLRDGLNQSDLARIMQLSRSTINKYVLGRREPDFDTVSKMSEIFNVSAGYLIGSSDNPTIQTVADPEDADLLAAAQGKLKDYAELPKNIQALNILLAEHGYCIRRIDGEQDYNVFTREGMFTVDEGVLNDLAAKSSQSIREKIDYLDMENKVRLLEEFKKKNRL